jgi:hypothetical protein
MLIKNKYHHFRSCRFWKSTAGGAQRLADLSQQNDFEDFAHDMLRLSSSANVTPQHVETVLAMC